MPTLEWIGKDKVVNHPQQVPYRVLEEKYTYNAEKSASRLSAAIIWRRSRLCCPNMRDGLSEFISIHRITPATKDGSTTTMLMIQKSKSGWVRLSVKKEKI